MKKFFAVLLCLTLLAAFAGCAGVPVTVQTGRADGTEAQVELVIFAAASLTETLTKIAELYRTAAPQVKLIFTFDSSGTLETQIQEGANCDLFLSAAQTQMDALDKSQKGEKNPDGLDFIDTATRIDLLENQVVLVVPEGNPAGISSFADLTSEKLRLLAIGNSDVPVGQYTLEIFTALGTSPQALEAEGKLTYGSNVKEVATQVAEAAVDAGIVYATDAFSAGLTVVDAATAEMCGRVVYPAAVLNGCRYPEAAQSFLDYLQSDEAMAVFESVGFRPVK